MTTLMRPEQCDLARDWAHGSGADLLTISSGGVITMSGTAKRVLTLRAELNIDEIKKQGVPDQVHIGAGVFFGYSMPIYVADPESFEELHFRESVPARWDGASNIVFHVLCCLGALQTPGQKFKFQFSWNQVGTTDIVPVATHDTTDEVTLIDNTQFATYEMTFIIDYDTDVGDPIVAHDLLAARLRRVAATSDEMDGEPVILDWHTHYVVDKMFKAP